MEYSKNTPILFAILFGCLLSVGFGPDLYAFPNDDDKKGTTTAENEDKENYKLSNFTHNLTEQAKAGQLPEIVGREHEVIRLEGQLVSADRANAVATGQGGVGKTSLIQLLALRSVRGDSPIMLQGRPIFELDMNSLVEGTKYQGTFQTKLKFVVDEVKKRNGILFIDELHTLIGAGGEKGVSSAAEYLKPILEKGEITVVGATTEEEYQKYIATNAPLARRFGLPIQLDVPHASEVSHMLRAYRARIESHYGDYGLPIKVTDAAIDLAAKMAERYIIQPVNPDAAKTVLKDAVDRIAIRKLGAEPPELIDLRQEIRRLAFDIGPIKRMAEAGNQFSQVKLEELNKELDSLRSKEKAWTTAHREFKEVAEEFGKRLSEQLKAREALSAYVTFHETKPEGVESKAAGDGTYYTLKDNGDEREAEVLLAKVVELERQLTALEEKLGENHFGKSLSSSVGEKEVAQIIHERTGVSVEEIVDPYSTERIDAIRKHFLKIYPNQEAFVEQLVKAIYRRQTGAALPGSETRPIGIFTVAGKGSETQAMIERFAEGFKTKQTPLSNVLHLDGNDYSDRSTRTRLFGSDKGYVGYEQGGGVLMKHFRTHPNTVLRLTNVDKFHPSILAQLTNNRNDFFVGGDGTAVPRRNSFVIIELPESDALKGAMEAGEDDAERKYLRSVLGEEVAGYVDRLIQIKNASEGEDPAAAFKARVEQWIEGLSRQGIGVRVDDKVYEEVFRRLQKDSDVHRVFNDTVGDAFLNSQPRPGTGIFIEFKADANGGQGGFVARQVGCPDELARIANSN